MKNTFLTLTEVAKFEGLDYNTVYKKMQRNNFKPIKVKSLYRHGFEYRISLDQLSDMAKRRYYAQQKILLYLKVKKNNIKI